MPTTTPEPLDNYALQLIRRKARKLIKKKCFSRSDLEDIEQELTLAVLERWDRYDPAKMQPHSFVTMVVDHKAIDLLRSHGRRKEQAAGLLFDGLDDAASPMIDMSTEREIEQFELREDINTIMATMRPELRQAFTLLMEHPVSEVARQMSLTRYTLTKMIDEICHKFEAAGFGDDMEELFSAAVFQTDLDPTYNHLIEEDSMRGDEMTTEQHCTTAALLVHEPAEAYHAQASQNLSSHALADFRKCPVLFHKKRLALIPDQDCAAYVLGRAAHTMILEGRDAFDREYAIGGPINRKTGKPFGPDTKAAAKWSAMYGKKILSQQQFEIILAMTSSVHSQPAAARLLAAGVAEGVVRIDYCEVPCQIRMDWFDASAGLVDLKTCDDLTWFEADARRFGYTHQLAFYRAVLAQRIGRDVPVHLIAVEKKEPYRCGVWLVHEDALEAARRENEAAITRLCECQASGHWPTGYEDVRLLDVA